MSPRVGGWAVSGALYGLGVSRQSGVPGLKAEGSPFLDTAFKRGWEPRGPMAPLWCWGSLSLHPYTEVGTARIGDGIWGVAHEVLLAEAEPGVGGP